MMNTTVLGGPSSATNGRVAAPSSPKSVSISPTSFMVHVPYPSKSEIRAKWYSRDEEKHFSHLMLQELALYSRSLAATGDYSENAGSFTREILSNCVGMTHLLSCDVPKRYRGIKQARKDHARRVLRVQEWQKRNNIHRPEDLARVSERSSRSDRVKSYKVAFVMSSI